MLSLEQLVQVVHASTLSASEALRGKNLELIDTFFEEDVDESGLDPTTRAGLDALDAASEAAGPGEARRKIRAAKKEIEAAARAPNGPGRVAASGALRPKMVAVAYPTETPDGPASHTVHVPLITLVPMSMVELSELTFTTELELSVVKDELQIGFPVEGSDATADEPEGTRQVRPARATLQIVMNTSKASPGLKKLVEGYERALRAQIPG